MCPAIFEGGGPTSRPYSCDFPGQLKNWLRVQRVPPKLYCFGLQVSLCSTRSQPQDCRSLLNLLLLLDATGFPAALPSSRQNMHPWVALDTYAASNELGSTLILLSGLPEIIGIPGLLDAIGLDAPEELVAIKLRRHIHHCWSRLGHNFFFLILNPLRHCGAACQAEILGTASGAEMADIEQMKKIVPLITCDISFSEHVGVLVFGVNVTDLNFCNQSRATLWVRATCLIVGLRPLIIILITASLSSRTYNIALESEFFVLDGMLSMFVGMTLVCLIGMGLPFHRILMQN